MIPAVDYAEKLIRDAKDQPICITEDMLIDHPESHVGLYREERE